MRDNHRVSISEAVQVYARMASGGLNGGAPGNAAPLAIPPGIPRADLTPPVQEAFRVLMAEIAAFKEQTRARDDEIEVLKQRLRLAESFTVVDPMLNLRTRHAFVQELQRMIAYADGHRHDIAFVLIEVERLSMDATAHDTLLSEEGLKQVADALTDSTRTSDLLGRLGNEAFGALLMDTDAHRAERVAIRIRDAITSRNLSHPNRRAFLSARFGLCPLRDDLPWDETLAMAERDMHQRGVAERRTARGLRPDEDRPDSASRQAGNDVVNDAAP